MNRLLRSLLLLALSVFLFSPASHNIPSVQAQPAPFARVSPRLLAAYDKQDRQRVIITFRTQSDLKGASGAFALESMRAELASIQSQVLASLPKGEFILSAQYRVVPAFAGELTADGLRLLQANPLVESINPDYLMRKAEVDAGADALMRHNTVHLLGARGAGINVAVIDTGIDMAHGNTELTGSVYFTRCTLGAWGGSDCPDEDNISVVTDGDSHGTHVAGIISGKYGVAPDAGLAIFKALGDDGTGLQSEIIDAMDYIADNNGALGIHLVNMSLSSDERFNSELDCEDEMSAYADAVDAVTAAGPRIFAATGNDGDLVGVGAPACIPGVIGVGSLDDFAASADPQFPGCTSFGAAGLVSCYSNVNLNSVDLLAPGCSITSEMPSSPGNPNAEGGKCGTSMATPNAAGAAAVLMGLGHIGAFIEDTLASTGDTVVDIRNSLPYKSVDLTSAYVFWMHRAPDVSIVSQSSTHVEFAWTDNSSIETEYRLNRVNIGRGSTSLGTVAAGVLSTTDTNVPCGQLLYEVKAYSATFDALSGNGSAFATARLCPEAPIYVGQTRQVDELGLSWFDMAADEDHYRLERRYTSGDWTVLSDTLPAGSGYMYYVDPLPNVGVSGCEIEYRVSAWKDVDRSDYLEYAFNVCAPMHDLLEHVKDVTLPHVVETIDEAQHLTVTDRGDDSDPLFSCNFSYAQRTAWYRYIAPVNGYVAVDFIGSHFDQPYMVAYIEGPIDSTQVTDTCKTFISSDDEPLTLPVTGGFHYLFVVGIPNSVSPLYGSESFEITFDIIPDPLVPATNIQLQRVNAGADVLITWDDLSSEEYGYNVWRRDNVFDLTAELAGTTNPSAEQFIDAGQGTDCGFRVYDVSVIGDGVPGDYDGGQFLLRPCAPPNDHLPLAEAVTPGVPFTDVVPHSAGATSAPEEPVLGCYLTPQWKPLHTIWYKVSPESDSLLDVSLAGTTGITGWFSAVQVLTADSFFDLIPVACDASQNEFVYSSLSDVVIEGGRDTYIQVSYSGFPETTWDFEYHVAISVGDVAQSPVVLSAARGEDLDQDLVTLTWDDPNADETGYELEVSLDSGATYDPVTITPANVTQFAVDPAACDESRYRVRALHALGQSGWTDAAPLDACIPVPPPAAPSNFTLTRGTDQQQYTFSWTDNSDLETGFVIQGSPNAGANWNEHSTYSADITSGGPFNGLPCTNPDVRFRIRATGPSGDSDWVELAVPLCSQVVAPSNVVVVRPPANPIMAEVTWTDNSDNETGFLVERSSGGLWFYVVDVNPDVVTWSGSLACHTPTIRVRAESLPSAYSSPDVEAVVPPCTLAAPTAFVADRGIPGQSVVDLTWVDNSLAETSFDIEAYHPELEPLPWQFAGTTPADVQSHQLAGVTCQVTKLRIRASIFSDSIYSDWVELDLEPCATPAVPTGLQAARQPNGDVLVSWTAGDALPTRHRVSVSVDGGPFEFFGLSETVVMPETSITHIGASCSSALVYRIEAVNSPTGLTSTPAEVTAEDCAPVPVELLANGGFDSPPVPALAPWSVTQAAGDKQKCDDGKANSAPCYFLFKGGANEATVLVQKLVPPVLVLDAGTTARLSFSYRTNNAVPSATVSALFTFADSTTQKLKIKVVAKSKTAYTLMQASAVLNATTVSAVKVKLKNAAAVGSLMIDDISLTVTPPDVLPPPAAPAGMRGLAGG